MIYFFKKSFFFVFLFAICMSVLVGVTTLLVKRNFNYCVGKNINTIILGDSHTLCGMDESIIPNSLNLSESADAYFYSYLKFREIQKRNPQIKTLILAYSQHNVSPSENNWLTQDNIIKKKLPFYFFLFNKEDFIEFNRFSPLGFLKNTARIIKFNIGHLYRIESGYKINQFGIGSFLKLEHSAKLSNLNEKVGTKSISHKKNIDLVYLEKIYQLCKENKIKLILINTPCLVYSKTYNQIYYGFQRNKLPEASLYDFTNLIKDPEFFADSSHLNGKGATLFSKYFAEKIQKNMNEKR